jgi:CDP-paratose 2-epimerase
MSRTVLLTGGAGFIGSNLAIDLKARHPGDRVIALDNLRRRGSELNLPRLHAAGVEFRHGDVRSESDLRGLAARLDVLIECSADPSVLAGCDGRARYVVDTNLMGCVNCLELARDHQALLVFLSTSRVYPTRTLGELRYQKIGRRFQLTSEQPMSGASGRGISEDFPLAGARTLYGTTKLASELLIAEYVEMFGIRAIVNRCGVVSGPWQMGQAEQGVFAHWLMAHMFKRPLTYIGFGGAGHQVRDVLHVSDLAELIDIQLSSAGEPAGEVFNAGGGAVNSVSLAEYTGICEELTGTTLQIGSTPEMRAGDVPVYVTDNTKIGGRFGWQPRRGVRQIATDLHRWLSEHASALGTVIGTGPGTGGGTGRPHR